MKLLTVTRMATVCITVALSGCVVAPLGARPGYGGPGYGGPGYGESPGVVYVAPSYAIPGPGYAWQHHGRFGWGWRHPGHGWHRGWR
jgi:hypothetical protein